MKDRLKVIDGWIDRHRPWVLILTAVSTLVLLAAFDWLTEAGLFSRFFYPKPCSSDAKAYCFPIAWKDLFQAAVLLVGLPAAFWLWHWRDRNMRDGISNSRKDINIKEFQEVQLRAAGALDEKYPEEAREQLQIAALHQLRGFLRGDYGQDFRRAAFVLILAGHGSAVARLQLWQKHMSDEPAQIHSDIRDAMALLNRVDIERLGIIRDEWRAIFNAGFPLSGRNFDFVSLPIKAALNHLDLSQCSFTGAVLTEVNLTGADLSDAWLVGADLMSATLEDADFVGAQMQCSMMTAAYAKEANFASANLRWASFNAASLVAARFVHANLANAHLDGADLQECNFHGAHLSLADLSQAILAGARMTKVEIDGLKLDGAVYDQQTIITDSLTGDPDGEIDRAASETLLRELGARALLEVTQGK